MTTGAPAVVKSQRKILFIPGVSKLNHFGLEVKSRIADDDVAALSGTDISTHQGFQQQEERMVVHNCTIFLCSLVVGNIDDQ